MLLEPSHKLGYRVMILDPTPKSPAGRYADGQIVAGYADGKATLGLGRLSSHVTIELEHVNAQALARIEEAGIPVNPSPETIAMIQDKYTQKAVLLAAGIPVAPCREVTTMNHMREAVEEFGFPLHLKARRNAFDGRGNAFLRDASEVKAAWQQFQQKGPLYVEQHIPFTHELAAVAARDTEGTIALYPIVETRHKRNICHTVLAPAPVAEPIHRNAEAIALQTMSILKGSGVFAIEMFLTADGEIYVNEIAPRVHNSGHWTQAGARTSQFENHVRGVVGLPLGSTEMTAPTAVMVNILGDREGKANPKGLKEALGISPNVTIYLYGKDPRPDRKVGHINAVGDTLEAALDIAQRARQEISI